MELKISIITATYNRRDLLLRCMESVAAQSYPHKEHVIVDGASTDGTVQLIKEFAERHPHVKWVSEKDNGPSNALNKGLAMASGDLMVVIGDDDVYLPEVFHTIAHEFSQNADVGIVSGNCDAVRNDGSLIGTMKASFTSRRDLIECWRYWCNRASLPAPGTFFRKQVVELVGGFDEADRHAMDYHHWIKMTEKFKVKTIDEVIAKYRLDQGSISFSKQREQHAEMIQISKRYWGTRKGIGFYRFLLSYLRYHQYAAYKNRIRNKASTILRALSLPN